MGCTDVGQQLTAVFIRKCVSVCITRSSEGDRCAVGYLCADLSLFSSSVHRIARFQTLSFVELLLMIVVIVNAFKLNITAGNCSMIFCFRTS